MEINKHLIIIFKFDGDIMKIILSRKGFDSANGGIVSPIMEDGTLVSFPIPADEDDNGNFDDLI